MREILICVLLIVFILTFGVAICLLLKIAWEMFKDWRNDRHE